MQVFISHSSEDNKIVEKIIELFDYYDVEYWVDIQVLRGLGHSVDGEINKGLETSTHFLLVWSKHAKKSIWVTKEHNVSTSNDYDKRLTKIIFKLDDEVLPALLSPIKHYSVKEENIEFVVTDVAKNVLEVDTDTIDQFNSDLNDQNGQVKIGDTYYDFMDVLKCVDKTEYKSLLDDWINDQLERRKEEYNQA